MASALTWTTLGTNLAAALVAGQFPYTTVTNDFTQLLPQATSYAESRIYRDIVLLATRTQDSSLSTTAASRTLNLSAMTTLVSVPEGVALTASGVSYPFDMTSLDVIDLLWPQQSTTLAPSAADWIGRYWALRDNQTIVLCPTPDAAYTAVITGLFQPTPISAANPTTYLATVYPELLLAACMVFMTGAYLRNFGAQADSPQQAVSWEAQYQTLMQSARSEEMRRRGLAPDHVVAAGGASAAGGALAARQAQGGVG